MLQLSKTCPWLVLATLLLMLAFPVWSQIYVGENPRVVVSVYDDARVPATVLAQAERKAAKIFNRAGLDVVWANCSSSLQDAGRNVLVQVGEPSSWGLAFEPGDPGRAGAPAPTRAASANEAGCARFDWPTHLAVRIVPRSSTSTNEVFGVAFLSAEGAGCYSDVFYDRAAELQTASNVGLADILGNVVAHELGHLLLGSNSHAPAGIMRGRWQREELHRMARGGLLFTVEQAEHMRGKLIAARPPLAVAVRSSN